MKKNDLYLIAVLLLVTVAGFALFTALQKGGDTAVLLIGGEEEARFSLSADTEQVISTDAGINVLVIENGKAYIREADCPDGICANHRPISKVGQTITCLPHKVVIKIESQTAEQTLDIVVQ